MTLLTTPPYRELLAASPYFDAVSIDTKPKPWRIGAVMAIRRLLRTGDYDLVIDLQCSSRSSAYWWFFRFPKPSFSGVAHFASHRYADAARHTRHAYDNLQRQLALLDITLTGTPDVSWLTSDISAIIPTGESMLAKNIVPVLVGSNAETEILHIIATRVPRALNLCGKTSFAEIASLASSAAFAVGNDTGPMHIIAASNCPSLVLFSGASDPERSAPLQAVTLQKENLADLTLAEVVSAASRLDSKAAKALA
jgi:ADP-heptose:LPS heptosyltransferase